MLRVMHTINTVAQPVMLKIYQIIKPFPDTWSIKDYIRYKGGDYSQYNQTMRNVIEGTNASGDQYDITLIKKCIKDIRYLHYHEMPHRKAFSYFLDHL